MRLLRALRLGPDAVVSFTGGGGKTTLMFRLAAELAASGRGVVTTMTTKIFAGQMAQAPAHLYYQDAVSLLAELPPALRAYRHVLVVGGELAGEGKVQGLPPEVIARIAALPEVDAVLVEADGSRRLPFKAPAEHEPVVPPSTTLLVPLGGLDVIGRPLDEAHVHRPERVSALSGVPLGAAVTPEAVARVLADPAGGAKGLPAGVRLVPFLNKADLPGALAAGRAVAQGLIALTGIDSVVIGAAASEDPAGEVWSRTGAVVLAAGRGQRFGSLKQVQPWRGLPLVAHVASQALHCTGINRVVVTVGAEAQRVESAVREAGDVRTVNVPDWSSGQSRSVKAGLAALADDGCRAVLFLLADQPAVTPALLSALIQRHRETGAPIVAPRFEGRRGNPVLFDAATFAEFAELEGDTGARPIIRRHADEVAWVDWPSADILNDIDTPADYHAAL